MENKAYSDVIGSPAAPFENRLAKRYGLATHYFAVSHPSLPNYLAMIGGSTYSITSDCTSCTVSGPNLATELDRAGISWRAYMDAMPSACSRAPYSGNYAKKHDPFVYFPSFAGSSSCRKNVVPGSSLGQDISTGHLPHFVWITPDLCEDTHDCPVSTGDSYLANLVPGLLKGLGPDGVLFIVWDEGNDNSGCCGGRAAGGQVPAIVAGGLAARGATSSIPYDHYSLLRTIEDLFGLPHLGSAACPCTHSMSALLRSH
jgi:phosphatidylinositol-3-phosphatase